MEIRGVTTSDVLDFMIGVRKEVPGEITSLVEHRFGIPLPLPTFGPGMLSFDAKPTCSALMRIESPSLPAPIVLRCELFSSPYFLQGQRRARVKGGVVDFTVTQNANGTVTGNLEWPSAAGMAWSLADWETHALVRRLPESASVVIHVETEEGEPSRFAFPAREVDPNRTVAPDRADAIATLRSLCLTVGLDPSLLFEREAVWSMADAAYPLTCLERGALMHMEATGDIARAVGSTVVVCGEVTIGTTRLVWDGVMTIAGVTDAPGGFDVRRFLLKGVRRVARTLDLDGEATRLESEHGAAFAVVVEERQDGYTLRAVVLPEPPGDAQGDAPPHAHDVPRLPSGH